MFGDPASGPSYFVKLSRRYAASAPRPNTHKRREEISRAIIFASLQLVRAVDLEFDELEFNNVASENASTAEPVKRHKTAGINN